jgi:basic membrane protein A
MRIDAPAAVLTSVLWHWGAYYTTIVQSIINGTFTTTPYFGSLKDGIVGLSPLNETIVWDAQTIDMLKEEQRRIESGEFDVFTGVLETNDGRSIGKPGEIFADETIRNGINWYYHTVTEL